VWERVRVGVLERGGPCSRMRLTLGEAGLARGGILPSSEADLARGDV
jgi:hypothetical protein